MFGICVQPTMFPAVYMVERMANVSSVVLLPQTQYDKHHTRFTIDNQGQPLLISPPFKKNRTTPFTEAIMEEPSVWANKLYYQLYHAYKKTHYYDEVMASVMDLLGKLVASDRTAATMGTFCMIWVIEKLGLNACVTYEYTRGYDDPSEWIAYLCSLHGITDYVQGRAGYESYLNTDRFRERGITLWYQQYHHEKASISILDVMFKHGFKNALQAITPMTEHGKVPTLMEWSYA